MRILGFFLSMGLAACATAPAARSPLREELAKTDGPKLEETTRKCLSKSGWRVDPIPGVMGGADVISAFKGKGRTDVYIYAADMKPRITGGPDYEWDPFWSCLGSELAPANPKSSP
jgi:hypothetical protein